LSDNSVSSGGLPQSLAVLIVSENVRVYHSAMTFKSEFRDLDQLVCVTPMEILSFAGLMRGWVLEAEVLKMCGTM